MKTFTKSLRAAVASLIALVCLAVAAPAMAWDATLYSVAVGRIDVDGSGVVWVYTNPTQAMCGTGTPTLAQIAPSSAAYSATVATLQIAKTTGGPVNLYLTASGGQCYLGYVSLL